MFAAIPAAILALKRRLRPSPRLYRAWKNAPIIRAALRVSGKARRIVRVLTSRTLLQHYSEALNMLRTIIVSLLWTIIALLITSAIGFGAGFLLSKKHVSVNESGVHLADAGGEHYKS
jgi:ABC-type glycerol-3-phosphate transport system permease component